LAKAGTSIPTTPGRSHAAQTARCTPEGDVELVTKKEILGFQLPPRFEQVGDEHRKQMKDGKHRSASLMVEILKDNARPEAGAVYGAMDMPWAKLVGQIAHAYGK
jgi:hypothetical protein